MLNSPSFLSEYNGHWVYARERGNAPVLDIESDKNFNYGGESFELYNRYNFKVINAIGEFPYNAFNDQDKNVKEFISPPEVWILEKNAKEGIIWFLGEHITGHELYRGFAANIILPYKTGIGAVEPTTYVNPIKIAVVSFVTVLVLIIAHLLSTMDLQNRVLIDTSYSVADSGNSISIGTGKFDLIRRAATCSLIFTRRWIIVGLSYPSTS